MKRCIYILAIAAILLPGCKKETWIDWRVENQLWLEHISKQDGVIPTPTGLRYKVIREGISTQPHPDDLKTAKVNYVGSLIGPYNNPTAGHVFSQGENAYLPVSSLISGFAEGLKKMTSGAHYILYIPYDLGYGADGNGTEGGVGYIPPYSTLVFDVTLISVD